MSEKEQTFTVDNWSDYMSTLSRRVRVSPNYLSYRQKNFFVDIRFVVDCQTYYAHKLVLARFSEFFDKFFDRNGKASEFSVPLDINNTFVKLVDFLYENKISFERDNFQVATAMYAMASFYGVADIVEMLDAYLRNEIVLHKERVMHETIFSMTKIFNDSVICEHENMLPEIELGKQRLEDAQSIFIPYLCEHFHDIVTNAWPLMRDSVTPYLLAKLMNVTRAPYQLIAPLIDDYIVSHDTDPKYFPLFEDVIDWSDPGVAYLFVNHEMNWVSPARSREHLSRLINNRRESIASLERQTASYNGNFSRWYLFNWFTEIRSSMGSTSLAPLELIDFLGTLGGLCNPVNIEAFGWVRNLSSPAMDTLHYTSSVLFDRKAHLEHKDRFYMSELTPSRSNQLGLGVAFPLFTFAVQQVVVESPFTGSKGLSAKQMACQGSTLGKGVWVVQGVKNRPDIDQVTFGPVMGQPANLIRIIPMPGGGEFAVLRANKIEIFGVFTVM